MTPERLAVIESILKLPAHSRILLLGTSDTGKTTLAAEIVNTLMLRGKLPLAVVDADTGQSEIGPPGVVGLGVIARSDKPPPHIRSLANIPYVAGAFVGATSPVSHTLEAATATIRMINQAMAVSPEQRPIYLLIDTPGLVFVPGASYLKAVIAMARPQMIVAFEHKDELAPILKTIAPTQVVRLPIAAEIARKSSEVRAARRAARFAHCFSTAKPMLLQWESVVFENTTLTYGTPLSPAELKYVGDTLGGVCVHAERQRDGQLSVFLTPTPPPKNPSNTGPLEQPLRVNKVAVTTTGRFDHLLCGLHGPNGDLLDIGIITAMDFTRRHMELLTRLSHPGAIAKIAMGYIRLRPDGREAGQLHPSQAV